MIRTVLYFILVGISLIFTILFFIPYIIFWLLRMKKIRMVFLQNLSFYWSRLMIWGTGSKVEVFGLRNIPEGNALFVSNHQGAFDIILILGYIPRHIGFIAKIELGRIPILSIWMSLLRCVFMDRKSLRKSAKAIEKGISNLKNGYSMVIFPEGHRSKGGPMIKFKPGSLKLAIKSGVPIVPVTISGSYHVFEEEYKIKPAKVKMTIHPPIYINRISEEDKLGLVETVEKQIASAL